MAPTEGPMNSWVKRWNWFLAPLFFSDPYEVISDEGPINDHDRTILRSVLSNFEHLPWAKKSVRTRADHLDIASRMNKQLQDALDLTHDKTIGLH